MDYGYISLRQYCIMTTLWIDSYFIMAIFFILYHDSDIAHTIIAIWWYTMVLTLWLWQWFMATYDETWYMFSIRKMYSIGFVVSLSCLLARSRSVGRKFILWGLKRADPWELVTAFLGGTGVCLSIFKYRTSETPFAAIWTNIFSSFCGRIV